MERALPDVSLQYVDYALWHRQWLESESFAAQLAYWRGRMDDAPILRLPSRRMRR